MRKLLLWSLIAVWSWTAIAPAARAADDDPSGEHLLPPETLMFFTIPDVPGMVEQSKTSTSGQLFAEPKLQPFINDVKAKVQDLFKEHVQGELGVTLDDLLDLPQGEITFAIVEKPARKLNAVLLVDCTDNEETLDKLIKKLDAALQDEAEHSTQTISDVEVHVYKQNNAGNSPYNTLAYFRDEGYVGFGSDVAALKSVLERWSGDNEDTLAKADVFAYIQEKCATGDEEPSMKWYLDVVGLVKVGMSMGPNPQQAAIAAAMMPVLGLDKLKGIGGSAHMDVDGYEAISKTFIYAEQPPTGILGAFQFPATEQQPPKWAPADAANMITANWDIAGAYTAIESLVDSLQGPGAMAKVIDAYATREDGPKVHLKKDVIDLLNGRLDVVMQATPVGGDEPPMPAFAIAFGLKDSAQMKQTVARAVEADNFPGETRQVNSDTVYEMPAQNGNKIAFAVGAESAVVASKPELMDRILKGDARNSLAGSPEYAQFAKKFPSKTSFISFQRSDTQLESSYNMLKKQNPTVIEGIDFTKLPDFSAIKKYFRPTGGYAVPDKKGSLVIGFSLPAQ